MTEVAVITGATGGIGTHIARGLRDAGFLAVAIGRDPAKLASLRRALPEVETVEADLSLVAAARAAGDAIARRHGRVARLVNNAGLFTTERRDTAEGHERTLATNHLVPFALTDALRPALAAHGAARIVNVGSVMAEHVRLDLDDLELRRGWTGPRAYGRSKLLLAAATVAWARHLAGENVVANVVHPGSVATGIVRDGVLAPLAWRLMRPFLLSPEAGAASPLHLCLSPEWGQRTGCYTRRTTEAPARALALDPALVDRVWATTRDIVTP